ncbi:MAG: RsmB/NOP family class I SAM-dependent RNA methyltransferase [Acidimicrobiia bacterium]
MSDPLEARSIAAVVVGRVLRSGAYSNVLAETASAELSPRDRSRVKALVFGVLRRLEAVDAALEAAAQRELDSLDPALLDRLRVSGFEILYGRLPAAVAVSAGVDLVRAVNPRAAGLANAVLRGISGLERPVSAGVRLPRWLVTRLSDAWGPERAEEFAAASGIEPERVVRVRAGTSGGHAGIPGALAVDPGPIPGGTVVQDAASIAVGNVVAAEPGMTVLDLAAAPGGKTLHLVDQVGPHGVVVALDRHRRRVEDGARRVPEARWVLGDGTLPPFAGRSFDRVLVDAPCSALGTLRRRPEIRFRVTEAVVEDLALLQRRILEEALELLAPGGRLVYSVCTITPEETIGVTRNLDFTPPDLPGEVWGDGRLLAPHLTSTDGMFIAVHQG